MLIPCLQWLVHPTVAQDKFNSKEQNKNKNSN